jgi:hypothetical protein
MNITKKTQRALTVAASLALTIGGLGISATAAQAATYKGGVSMQWACEKQYPGQGRTARVLDQRNAFSWVCKSQFGHQGGIDVNRACRDTYGGGAYAQLGDRRNPYTWYCVK